MLKLVSSTQLPADTTPPIISFISVENIDANNVLIHYWVTNEPA